VDISDDPQPPLSNSDPRVLVAALVLLAPAAAQAHPLSLSGFDAWAGESDVRDRVQARRPSSSPCSAAARSAVPLSAIRDERATT
jgi:hypothetical protein